jgi:hypothetical protein
MYSMMVKFSKFTELMQYKFVTITVHGICFVVVNYVK